MTHIRVAPPFDESQNWPSVTCEQTSGLGLELREFEDTSILRETLADLKRRWPLLTIWILTCFFAAVAYVLVTPQKFLGITQVVLEPRQSMAPLDPAAASTAPSLDSAQADSQVQVIQSERNLRYVFDTLNLAADPDFAGEGFDLVGWIQSRIPFSGNANGLSPEAKARLAKELAYSKFVGSVTVKRLAQSYAFEISFLALSPKKAAYLANSITAAYIRDQVIYNIAAAAAQRGEDFLQNRVSGSKTEQEVATEAVKTGLIPDYTFGHADARIVSAALEPITKSYPMTTVILALALAFGALSGVGASIVRDGLDRTVRSREQLRRLTGISAIGVLPRISGKRSRRGNSALQEMVNAPDSDFARTILNLRTSVMVKAAGSRHCCIGIVSCSAREGRTTVAANLAYAIAGSGRPITLLDADLDNPDLTKTFTPRAVSGFGELMKSRGADAAGLQVTINSTFSFIPALGVDGGRDPGLFVGSRETLEAVTGLTAERDVLIDLPPRSRSDDAIALGRPLTGVIVVVALNRTSVDELADYFRTLRANGMRVLDVLLNEAGAR